MLPNARGGKSACTVSTHCTACGFSLVMLSKGIQRAKMQVAWRLTAPHGSSPSDGREDTLIDGCGDREVERVACQGDLRMRRETGEEMQLVPRKSQPVGVAISSGAPATAIWTCGKHG